MSPLTLKRLANALHDLKRCGTELVNDPNVPAIVTQTLAVAISGVERVYTAYTTLLKRE